MIRLGYSYPMKKNTGMKKEELMDSTQEKILTAVLNLQSEMVTANKVLRTEINMDMEKIVTKIEKISGDHNVLNLEVARITENINLRFQKFEKDVTELWSHSREIRAIVTKTAGEIETHKEIDKNSKENKKATADWAKWLPAGIVAILTIYSIIAKI